MDRKVVTIDDVPHAAEKRCNDLYDKYQPLSFTTVIVKEQVRMVIVMIARSELGNPYAGLVQPGRPGGRFGQ